MIEGLKRDWHRLRTGKPGDRFQGSQRAHAEARHGKWARFVSLGGGALLIAVGIVALPAPGPGWLIIGLGAALIARESAMVARALDAIEVKLRKVLAC